jgi:hypothetical protein
MEAREHATVRKRAFEIYREQRSTQPHNPINTDVVVMMAPKKGTLAIHEIRAVCQTS